MSQSVGFIGLGSMGQPMVRNLLKASYRVTVYNRSDSRVTSPVQRMAMDLETIPQVCL